MASVAETDSHAPAVQALAEHVFRAAALPPLAVERWLRFAWVIKPDPVEVEWIKRPEFRALEGDYAGDCDDSATLAAALLLADPAALAGWALKLRAIRMPADREFSHVWLSAERGGFRVDIDPIVPAAHLPVRGYAEELTLRLV